MQEEGGAASKVLPRSPLSFKTERTNTEVNGRKEINSDKSSYGLDVLRFSFMRRCVGSFARSARMTPSVFFSLIFGGFFPFVAPG